MVSFKIRHTHRALLEWDRRPDSPWVFVSSAEPGVSFFLNSPIPQEEFAALQKDIESGTFIFAHNDDRLSPGKEVFCQTLEQYYKEKSLLILQDYDLYLLLGQERCRIWMRNDFFHVEPVPLGPVTAPREIRSRNELSMLKSAGRMFYHGEYLPMIRIPELPNRPLAPQDTDLEHKIQMALWPLAYPHTSATPKEMAMFMHQKTRLVATPGAERTILQALLLSPLTEIGQEARAVIQSINRRWKYYTGRHLIALSENATSQIAQLQI